MSLKNRLLENCFKISRFEIYLNFLWKILTNTLKTLANNQFKDNFYEKRKKEQLIFWQFFFIYHKNDVKTFPKWIVNQCPKNIGLHDPFFIYKVYEYENARA